MTIKAKTELNSKNHYDMQELHKILKELDGIKGEAGLIFKIQIATGARIGEICGLIADDIKDGIIYFNNQISLTDSKERVPLKTGDIRFTPIPKSIEEDIQKRIKDLNISGEDFLFKSRWRNAQRLRLIDIFTKCGTYRKLEQPHTVITYIELNQTWISVFIYHQVQCQQTMVGNILTYRFCKCNNLIP